MLITDRLDLLELLVAHCGQKTINVIISSVDFDAVGSALGLYHVLRMLGGRPAIYYAGHFALRQQKYLNDHYQLNELFRPLEGFRSSPLGDAYALVDSCTVHDDRLGSAKDSFTPIIIIDHHDTDDLVRQGIQFIWVESEVGAAATLVIELIQRLELFDQPLLNVKEVQLLALLLSLGIYTDTHRLTGMHDRDQDAYLWISNYFSKPDELDLLIGQLHDNTQRIAVALKQDSMNNLLLREDDAIIVDVGQLQPDAMHDVSVVADRMLTNHPEVNKVVAYGVISGDKPDVKVSVRARKGVFKSDQHFTLFMQEMFGRGAGGRIRPDGIAMGGASIELAQLMKAHTGHTPIPERKQIVLRHVSDRFRKSSIRMAIAQPSLCV